jgi:poly(3-hydroxybutyrate) depolymerase
MKKILLGFSILLFSLNSYSQLVARTLTASNGRMIGFYDFKPADYNTNTTKKYPLIIFLHGIGERGNGTSELYMLTWLAIPKLLANGGTMTFTNPKTGQRESFLVLCPQLDRSYGYWDTFYVDEMLKYAKQNLRYDENRVYLTGLSSGGGGTWRYPTASLENAQKFAAIAPVCGTCEWNPANFCSTLGAAKVAVYGFHAVDDGVASVYCLNTAVDAINACNPGLATTKVYPYGNHYIWDWAYDTTHNSQNPNMFEWFLGQSRSGTVPAPTPVNMQPVAKAGNDVTITQPANSVSLASAGSYDPDGTITSYSWSLVSGPTTWASIITPTGSTTQVQNLVGGTYVFRLTVTDNNWVASTDEVSVTVNAAPTPAQMPVAIAGNDVTIALPTTLAYLDGSASNSPGGTITKYNWTKIGGPSQYAISFPDRGSTYITNLVPGVYTFRLSITDSRSTTVSDDVQVTVNGDVVVQPAPLPPVNNTSASVNAGSDQSVPYPTTLAYLDGKATPSTGAAISKYTWSKVGGPDQYTISFADRAGTYMTNLVAGTYTFRLTMTDTKGVVASDDVVVTVAGNGVVQPAPAPPTPAPSGAIAAAGNDQTVFYPTSLVYVQGVGTPSSGATISKYNWSKISGPGQYTISFPDWAGTYFTNLVGGVYTFRLTVTDSKGAVATDDIVITLNGDPNAGPTQPVTQTIQAKAGNDVRISLPTTLAYVEGSGVPSTGAAITKYSWTKISGPDQFTISFPNFNGTYLTGLVQGSYTFRLTVTDSKGATASDDVIVTVAGVGSTTAGSNASLNVIDIVSSEANSKVMIYPNPVAGSLNFKWTSDFRGTAKLNIVNVSGQIVKTWQIKKDQQDFNKTMDVSALKPGVSMIQIQTNDGKSINKKFLKN